MRGRMPVVSARAGRVAVVIAAPGGCLAARGRRVSVRARNTSSRLGRRSATVPSAPDSSSTSSARRRPDTVPSVGTSRSSSPECVAQLDGLAAEPRLELVGGSGGDDATAVEHRDAVGERSASSRYCVVSSTVVPASASQRMTSHSSRRLRVSSPVVGSSRKSTLGVDDEAEREVEASAHAAGVGGDPPARHPPGRSARAAPSRAPSPRSRRAPTAARASRGSRRR